MATLTSVSQPRRVASRAPNRRGEGDVLREQLIEAASRLLAAPVVEEPLSLRAVAREVGVVPQSVYLHFADKPQLVRAVIERRFAELSRAMQSAEDAASGPVEKLRARSLAYCQFGLESPGHYALLFETRATGQIGTGFAGSPGAETFDQLVDAVKRCYAKSPLPRKNAFNIAINLWTGLHGIVSLRLSKPGFPWPPLEEVVDRLLRGIAGVDLPRRTARRQRTVS